MKQSSLFRRTVKFPADRSLGVSADSGGVFIQLNNTAATAFSMSAYVGDKENLDPLNELINALLDAKAHIRDA